MKIEIKIPSFSAKGNKCTLCQWNVSEGDTVEQGEILCEAEIDKTVRAIEAECKMTVIEILAEEGDEVDENTVIAYAESIS